MFLKFDSIVTRAHSAAAAPRQGAASVELLLASFG
jgi:hypothetical protein